MPFVSNFPSVIGRGGEMINKLQSESGAKIQVAAGLLFSFLCPRVFGVYRFLLVKYTETSINIC